MDESFTGSSFAALAKALNGGNSTMVNKSSLDKVKKPKKTSKKRKLDEVSRNDTSIKDNIHISSDVKSKTSDQTGNVNDSIPSGEIPIENNKPSSKPGRKYTVSVALPGSIIDNAQSDELRTYLAGQVARCMTIFNVDEVIVFDDRSRGITSNAAKGKEQWNSNLFLARILQYLETPQYLRKALIPRHKDLRMAGLLNPLDAPHHMRATEIAPYREGVSTDLKMKSNRKNKFCYVDVGLKKECLVNTPLKPGIRVTVAMKPENEDSNVSYKNPRGTAVAPSEPREKLGTYWGYRVRVAGNFNAVWSESPYKDGYDYAIGTSERGTSSVDQDEFAIPQFEHLLIVFGGVMGLEACVDADEALVISGEDTHSLFDCYLNVCPTQGSRTIRTEEAILIALSTLDVHIRKNVL